MELAMALPACLSRGSAQLLPSFPEENSCERFFTPHRRGQQATPSFSVSLPKRQSIFRQEPLISLQNPTLWRALILLKMIYHSRS